MDENEIRYKGYPVRACSYELKAGGWVPQVIVFESTNRRKVEHPPLLPPEDMTFSTRQQADKYALGMAKRFVNQRLAEGR